MSFEPTIVPQLKETLLDLSGIRFGIVYQNSYVNPAEPNIEGAHIHNHLEIFFNVTSDVSFLVGNRLYAVDQGDAVFSRSNEIHVCIYNSAQTHEFYCLWIDADEDTLRELLPIVINSSTPLLSYDDATKKKIQKSLRQLYSLQNNSSKNLEKTVCLLTLLSLIESTYADEELPETIPPALQTIIDDVHTNFAEINHVKDIMDRHFVSSATLNRWFRKYIRLSPREYLESKKLAHASKLLAQGVSVTDACYQAGFSDCSHFIILFKKKFGKTPFRYKATHVYEL
jgi:AraC-like DNA-binding protein